MIKNVLFDLDGTLTDPGLGITNSVSYALKKFGIEVKDRSELYKFIGPPLITSFTEFCGMSNEDATKAIEYYREYFRDTGIFENEIYEGIPELLANIRNSGQKVILATSKPEEFARRILEHFDLIKYFDFVAGATMDGTRNEKADVIRYAIKETNIDVDESIMVGDRKHDVIGAMENNIDTIGVLFGYGSREELEDAGAKHIAANIEELSEILSR